ncbi:MAG: hypothetical protein ACRYGR_07800 [Janthinobacterium lividum]
MAKFRTECSRKNNRIDTENKDQGNIQKIENFFIDVLPERFSKSIELRQNKALFHEYNVLFRQNNAFCLMQNQLADNTIVNYININLFIRRLENTYQLYPSDLNFYISSILEEFLDSVFKNSDQLFVLQQTKKLSFIPFAKLGLFIACDSLDKATEYFKYCNLDQISFDHFDNSEILKTCGYVSVVQEQKPRVDSNQDDQKSKKFFEAAANLGCEDSKNILDQFYQLKSDSDTDITVDHVEIIKNYGCAVKKLNIVVLEGLPMLQGILILTGLEKIILKSNLWSFWYHYELGDEEFPRSIRDEL